MKISAVCLLSIPSLDTGHDSVFLLSSGGSNPNSCLQGESGLANEGTTPPSSSDWTQESKWASNRTFPGSPGKEVPSSQKYLLNWQNISLELERAILLQLQKLLPEKKINTEEKRAKRQRDRFLATSLEHLEAAVLEDNSKPDFRRVNKLFFFFF